MKYIVFLFALLIVLINGCAIQSTSPVDAILDSEFRLKIGQTAFIRFESMKIALLNVTEDSRCPVDVVCVWQGQAKVLLRVEKESQISELSLSALEDEAIFDEYSVKLVSLEPYPISTKRIEFHEYVAAFVVSKTSQK